VLDRWEHSLLQSRLQELERGLKTQHRRMRALGNQITLFVT